jgi:hypothetical protein
MTTVATADNVIFEDNEIPLAFLRQAYDSAKGVLCGFRAGASVRLLDANVCVGSYAGVRLRGSLNVVIGYECLRYAQLSDCKNVFVGAGAAKSIASACDVVVFGYNAVAQSLAASLCAAVVIGANACAAASTVTAMVVMGDSAALRVTSGSNSIVIGYMAGAALLSISDSVVVGSNAALNATSFSGVAIGAEAAKRYTASSAVVLIGYKCGELGGSSTATSVTYDTAIGKIDAVLTSVTSSTNNTLLGNHRLLSSSNTLVGFPTFSSTTSQLSMSRFGSFTNYSSANSADSSTSFGHVSNARSSGVSIGSGILSAYGSPGTVSQVTVGANAAVSMGDDVTVMGASALTGSSSTSKTNFDKGTHVGAKSGQSSGITARHTGLNIGYLARNAATSSSTNDSYINIGANAGPRVNSNTIMIGGSGYTNTFVIASTSARLQLLTGQAVVNSPFGFYGTPIANFPVIVNGVSSLLTLYSAPPTPVTNPISATSVTVGVADVSNTLRVQVGSSAQTITLPAATNDRWHYYFIVTTDGTAACTITAGSAIMTTILFNATINSPVFAVNQTSISFAGGSKGVNRQIQIYATGSTWIAIGRSPTAAGITSA